MKTTALAATTAILAIMVAAASAESLSAVWMLSSSGSGRPAAAGTDCCVEHGTAGCDDPAIEECVCAIDPVCCIEVWDNLCVIFVEAGGCGDCGGGGPRCCTPRTAPGCPEDLTIQGCVCDRDPFCCNTEWDQTCVDEVEEFGCGFCDGIPNDACPDAVAVNSDTTLAINTDAATTDGPALPAACDEGGGLAFDSDVWYCYSPDCDGDVTVSLCGESFDNRLAIYEGCACPATNTRMIECSDNFCGFQAQITFNASSQMNYLIRVGGNGAVGTGELQITGGDTDNNFDCNDNGTFDGCDIRSGDSGDCNSNGIPDECELDDGRVLIQQLPNQSNGLFSDPDCGVCEAAGQQSVADQFRIFETTTIERVVLWGGYFPDNIPSLDDDFTVILQRSCAGLPCLPFTPQSGVPSTRIRTGVQLFGVDEWLFELTLPTPLTLDSGIYYIEVFNNTAGNTDSFFWEVGNRDAAAGANGNAVDANASPGVEWFANPEDQAFQLLGPPLNDCDNNRIPDVCQKEPVQVPGDLNDDCQVDIDDYELFLDCVTGPGGGPVAEDCQAVDFDEDDDVDLPDWGGFQDVFGSP
ncbi:MAG: hypothetical protein V3W34_13775 [Phycisphaerae bacterium]